MRAVRRDRGRRSTDRTRHTALPRPALHRALSSACAEDEAVLAEEPGAVEKAIEPPARRLAKVEAGHAGAAAATTAGVEGAAGFAPDEVLEEAVERGLE